MDVASAPQFQRFEINRVPDSALVNIRLWTRVKTLDGPVEVWTKSDDVDPNGFDGYQEAKNQYDDALAILTDDPYNLDVAVPPAGKLRHGFPETV